MNRVELKIYDGKTGQCKAVANRWQFQDVLMGEQFITLNISSETPIDFAIGDYCIFRGEEYILNYIPSLTQSAGIGERQDAFFYDSVKFNSHQDELSRCQMLDVTPTTGAYIASLGTNHTGSSRFSLYCGETTTEVVVDGVRKTVTLTAVCALAAKMQANLDRLYGEGKWLILVDTETTYKDGSGQDILVTHTDDKIIVFDNKTVLESLSEVHNTFDLDYSIKGRTIKIGYTLGNLTSDIDVEAFAFGYGKGYPTPLDSGKGLFQIKRISNSNQQVITRLRALGSTKNMPYRYYNKAYSNGNDDLSQTLFPTNLQLPGTFLEEGDPSDAPNPVGNTKWSRNNARSEYLRKVKGDTNDAYIDKDDDAESSVEGIREGSARWDGSDGNLQEIYPTIEESTYKELRDAGISDQDGDTGSTAFPNYGDYERIDELLAIGYDDNGEVVDDANKGNGILSESDSIDLGILRTTSIELTTLTYNKNDGGDFVEDSGRWVGKEVQLCVISDVMSGSYGFDPTIGAVSFGVRLSTENLWLNICYIVKIKQISKVNGLTTLLAEYVSDMFTNGTIEDGRAKFLSYVETFLSEIPDSKNGLSAKVKEVKVTELSDIIITFTPAMVIKELPAGVNSFPFTYHVGKSNIYPVNFEPESSWISFDGNETPKDTFHVFIKDLGFELSATFTDDTPVLAMKSGQCVGREFSIGENIQRVSYNGKKGYMLTLTRAKDSSLNTYYPNSNCVIAAGDRYVLLNISMPDVYIKAAEVRLLRAATEYLADNCETKYTYQPYIDDIYLRRNYDNMLASGTPEKSIFWRLYAGLKFTFRGIPSSIDAPLPIADITIERLTITMGEGLTPKVDLVLNDDVQQTTLQKLTTTVDRIYNGSLLSGGSGRTGSSTAALMSLLQTEGGKRFLSKLSPDTAQALITFLQGIAVGNGTYGIDGNGNANLNEGAFGKLTAQEAHFFNLIIDEVKSVGGQLVITPANCVIDKVEETSEAYKCYFRASDSGREINNEFEIGDQALHYEFDVTEGTSRNYWRLVIGKSTETIEKEIDGVAVDCHWVLLSKSDCKTDSDEPKSGDSLSMFGNRTDVTRQNGIVISAYNIPFIDTAPYLGQMVGIQAPLFASYKGVDSYEITQANRVNVIASNGNLFRGQVTIEHGSTLADGRPVNDLGTEDGNLLRNTYFGGDYESEPSSATTIMDEDTILWSDPLKHWVVDGEVATSEYADAKSGRCVSLSQGAIFQNVTLKSGVWHMLSFFASGESIDVERGGSSESIAISTTPTRHNIAFIANGNGVGFSGVGIIYDIILTEGTIPVEWARSPLDPTKEKALDISNEYLRKAISEASTSILGGLILSNIIKVGNYRLSEATGQWEMSQETGGMSGARNHDNSPFLWGGGDMVQAIHTIDKYKSNPAYEATPEEVAAMAQFVVTHGGRAILNDVILRGYIYALGGKFKGTVEATGGVFKNITTPNGSFSIDADGTAKIVNLLVENFGKIASAIFRGDYMLSQYGRAADTDAEDNNYEDFDINNPDGLSAWRPNIYLNFRTGKARLVNADIIGNICMPPLHVTSENFASLFEEANNRYYLRDWHLSMPAQSLQLEYLPADHDTVLCAQVLTSNYDWTHEGLTVTIVNISGRDYYYEEVMNWSTPTFRYSSIGDKTISQFQLLARPLAPWGYHVLPTLLSSRNI